MNPISLKGLHVGATMSQKAREIGSLSLVKVGEWCTQDLSYLGRSVRSIFISPVATNLRADNIKNNILLNQSFIKNFILTNCNDLKKVAGVSLNSNRRGA